MIGDRIKNRRIEIGMTQAELGKAAGVGKSTVSEWENSKRKPSIDTISILAQKLETTPEYLMDWPREFDELDKSILKRHPDFRPGSPTDDAQTGTLRDEIIGMLDDLNQDEVKFIYQTLKGILLNP